MKSQLCESELIRLVSIGDREAFAVLYSNYLHNIYRYVFSICYSKETAEEIVQDLFVKLWENKEGLIYILAIKPYLYRSARNLLLNYIKKNKVEARVLTMVVQHTAEGANTTEQELFYSEYDMIAKTAIELLPEKRKEIFKLRLNDDLSLDEISTKLNISKSVVKKQLYSGISFVRKYLYKHGEITLLILSSTFFVNK